MVPKKTCGFAVACESVLSEEMTENMEQVVMEGVNCSMNLMTVAE